MFLIKKQKQILVVKCIFFLFLCFKEYKTVVENSCKEWLIGFTLFFYGDNLVSFSFTLLNKSFFLLLATYCLNNQFWTSIYSWNI